MLAVLSFVGCRRDHLHYATSDQVVVRFNIDWSVSQFSPNGVTVYIYGSNGNRYGNSILSSNTEVVTTTLPADTYTVVVHNDSRSEFSNVEFINTDKLSTFMVRSLEWDHPYYEPDTDEFVALEPEDIVSATVRNIEVTGNVCNYHYDKPNLSDYTSTEVIEVDITPKYIVHLAEVQAHIENAHNAVDVPIALVHGMSRGYYFGYECTSEDRVIEEFYVDMAMFSATSSTEDAVTKMAITRTDSEYTYEDDNIYLDFRTFGLPFDSPDDGEDGDLDDDGLLDNLDNMHTVDDDFHDVFIELLFNMGSGMVYHIFAEVTESLDIDDIVLRKKYTIIIEDDLNNYEPYYDEDYDTDDDEGTADDEVFQPSIDTWVDVVIPLPL
ncbi:MAG: DUF5119 domain-containing protein [Rikenellaceae bacterium]